MKKTVHFLSFSFFFFLFLSFSSSLSSETDFCFFLCWLSKKIKLWQVCTRQQKADFGRTIPIGLVAIRVAMIVGLVLLAISNQMLSVCLCFIFLLFFIF